jgi:CheY-like chemotaxis protein
MVGQLSDRVLLVEDEPFVRKAISGYLVGLGYVVRVAVDGLDALAKLRVGLPDLIISDLHMPRMSGFEFLQVARIRFPHIPVIVMGGAGPDEMPVGLAADAYFHKNGLGLDQLLVTILALTKNPHPETAPPYFDNIPVPARWDGDGHYNLDCADCLRVFSIPRNPNLRPDERLTVCVHCGKAVRFFVADGGAQGPAAQ